MIRKIQTSQGKRKFLHEQSRLKQFPQNQVTRPPTSHPYSSLRYLRSHQHISQPRMDSNYIASQFTNKKYHKESMLSKFQLHHKDIKCSKMFTHVIQQINILTKNLSIEEHQTVQHLLANLTKRISELQRENQTNIQKCKEMGQKITALTEENDNIATKIQKIEVNWGEEKMREGKPAASKEELNCFLENVRLGQMNSYYLARINELETKTESKRIDIKREVNESDNTDILRFQNRISYLEMKLKNSEEKQNELEGSIKQLSSSLLQKNSQIEQLNQKNTDLLERLHQWRERAMMQYQDSEIHVVRQNFLLFSIKKLRESNKSLADKLITQSGGDEGQVKKQDFQSNPYFQYEVDFFKSIKGVYFESKFKQFKMSLQNKSHEGQLQNLTLEEEYIEYKKQEQVNLSQYCYYVPTFFSFIEESITNEISQCRMRGNASVSRIFIQLLRSILNSKINEFIMYSNEDKYSRFPQFVYAWFEKFYFNSQKSDIATLEPYMQKPFPQDMFYRDLMNVKLDQSWQIITFREFLLEQLSLEDLYFYLMCQNLLYKKAGITKQMQYMGQFCLLAEYNAAKSVLDIILSDFQSWNLSFLTSKLRQKIIYKKNVEYIECGFFLRCLVEYYKIQRINRYKYIFKLCDQFKSCEKGLRFSSFISVINRFTEVTIDQKIKLYRDCFSVSKGKITADVIFTVCSEQLIFLKYLKLKCFYKLPLLTSQRTLKNSHALLKRNQPSKGNSTKKPIICLQPPHPYLYDIFTKMIELLRSEGPFMKKVESLGMVDLVNHILNIQKIFSDKVSNNESSLLKCRHFIHFMSDTLAKIRIVNFQFFYELLEEQNKKKNSSHFWIQIEESHLCEIFASQSKATFEIFRKVNQFANWKTKVSNFRVNNAARKIQRQVRKKFIAPFLQLYKMIYSEVKNGTDPRSVKK